MAIVRMSNVEFNHWGRLKSAVNQMVDKGIYEDLVGIHAARDVLNNGISRHRMHGRIGDVGRRRFLPWHRAYLIVFERELRKIDENLSIPYWDWDNDQGRLIGFNDYLPDVDGKEERELGFSPGGQRNSRNNIGWFSSDRQNSLLETSTDSYDDFTTKLEGEPHNIGHGWIGGNMAHIQYSPRDIVFWLHHAAIDRVWAKWQESNRDKYADLKGKDAKLDPWEDEFDVKNINDISKLGEDSYSYQIPNRPSRRAYR